MSKWWAGAIIWKREADGLYFLVQDARNINPKYRASHLQTKWPGGKKRHGPKEKKQYRTALRELEEELGLVWRAGTCPYLLHTYMKEKGHKMFFYLMEFSGFEGTLRTEEVSDTSSRLFPPHWVKAEEAGRYLIASHQGALLKALQYFGLMV